MNNQSSIPKLIGIVIAVLLCCACILILGAAGLIFYEYRGLPTTDITPFSPPNTGVTPVPPVEITRPPVDSVSQDTFRSLQDTIVPENNPYELACRLQGVCGVPETLPPPAVPLTVGAKQKFWLLNTDTNKNFQIDATLLYITPQTYFWAQDGVDVKRNDVEALMDFFEKKIIPTNREFFGSEWTPGVDGDPHIYVVYGGDIGSNIAGYFSTPDEYNPLVREYSNAHELFVLNTSQDLAAEYTYTTLAHEFVHMIQWPSDRNDVSWINEGFAEVGAFLNGYDVGGADWVYVQNPDLQLNTWVDPSSPDFAPHYGQSFLYLAYFLDRFGENATKALTNNPKNDLTSVDDTLQSLNITDPQTGKVITTDDVFMDWAATLLLMDDSVGDGRYTYHNYPQAPRALETDVIDNCSQARLDGSVNQYGIDYIGIQCEGDHTLTFTGSTQASLLPALPHSGSYAFWSNRGDESDMTLTREFDFTGVSGSIELSYWTWYDLETDYDYLYLEASTDSVTWQILTTPSGTAEDPSGNSYGWGYNGQTNGWRQEKVDLSGFAGKKIQVRFEYITDTAVNGEGFLLDDISINAIDYLSDFEADDGGWTASGFARVQNVLPQTYRLSLIKKGTTTIVTSIPLNPDQRAEIPLSLKSGEKAVLIVTGTTRFTRLPTAYQIEVRWSANWREHVNCAEITGIGTG